MHRQGKYGEDVPAHEAREASDLRRLFARYGDWAQGVFPYAMHRGGLPEFLHTADRVANAEVKLPVG